MLRDFDEQRSRRAGAYPTASTKNWKWRCTTTAWRSCSTARPAPDRHLQSGDLENIAHSFASIARMVANKSPGGRLFATSVCEHSKAWV